MNIAAGILGYLIGNFSSAIVISKLLAHEDVRGHGSKNPGAANMLRNYGTGMGVATFVCDFLKGVIAVLIGRLIGGEVAGYYAAVAVVVGHIFPIFLGFKGGKGVSTAVGVMATINITATLVIFVICIGFILFTHYVSVASVFGLSLAPFVIGILYWGNWPMIISVAIISALVVFSHRKNIGRLMRGEETKAHFSKYGERNGK